MNSPSKLINVSSCSVGLGDDEDGVRIANQGMRPGAHQGDRAQVTKSLGVSSHGRKVNISKKKAFWSRDFTLPGRGEPGKDCGNDSVMVCRDCGTWFRGTSHCHQAKCPNCWSGWTVSESQGASRRLWQWYLTQASKRGRVLHVSVSRDGVGIEKGELYRILQKHGLEGGLIIAHPWRGTFPGGRPDMGNPDDMRYSTHWHVVAYARGHVRPGDERDDYVLKVIRDAKNHDYKGLRRERDLGALLHYQLSHCGISDRIHAVTWWGCMSYRKWKYKPQLTGKNKCPSCGGTNTRRLMSWEFMVKTASHEKPWWDVYEQLLVSVGGTMGVP